MRGLDNKVITLINAPHPHSLTGMVGWIAYPHATYIGRQRIAWMANFYLSVIDLSSLTHNAIHQSTSRRGGDTCVLGIANIHGKAIPYHHRHRAVIIISAELVVALCATTTLSPPPPTMFFISSPRVRVVSGEEREKSLE